MATVITENTVTINRPIAEVFETATCLESCINWWTMVQDTKKITPGPTAVGTEYLHSGKFMGIKVESHPVVTVLEPPYQFAYRSETSSAIMNVEYRFESVDSGTKMTMKMVAEPIGNLVTQTMMPLVISATKRQFQNDMLSLKDMMESGVKVKVW
jgi:hypothetical protein